jgi:hypothetical protein
MSFTAAPLVSTDDEIAGACVAALAIILVRAKRCAHTKVNMRNPAAEEKVRFAQLKHKISQEMVRTASREEDRSKGRSTVRMTCAG